MILTRPQDFDRAIAAVHGLSEIHVLSLGAGVQSTTVYLLAHVGEIPPLHVAVFADTQEEPRAVYEHLAWLQSLDGPPILVRTAGRLGDDLVAGRNSTGRWASIPAYTAPVGTVGEATGQTRRQCSKEYKVEVVERAIRRELIGLKPRQRWPRSVSVRQYFGISLDEARRAASIIRLPRFAESGGKQTAHFPLLDRGWTRGDCLRWLEERVPHAVPRSACVFCPYKSDAEWLRLKQDDAEGWARAVEVDEALRRHGSVVNRQLDQPLFVHRSGKPLASATLRGEGQATFPYFVQECEGMCGI